MELLRRYGRFDKPLRGKPASGGFTLFEILIVIAIIAILAAVAISEFQDDRQKAKESAAKGNLRLLRTAIELYAAEHTGTPPGYEGGDITKTPTSVIFTDQLCRETDSKGTTVSSGAVNPLGSYLSAIPENPFNNKNTIRMLAGNAEFPEASGTFGWVYKPSIKTIKLDWPGSDSEDIKYYDY